MKLLVFGRTGQVARELARHCPGDWALTALGREAADLAAPGRCAAAIAEAAPDLIINAAAYTAVDRAEEEPELARRVNGAAPGEMAREAAARAIPLLHVSTDYVFDGSGTDPWAPGDATGPLGIYGQSKLEGEEAIRQAGGVHAILRTSWVFSAHGANFVRTMLRLGRERDALNVVSDQIGGPTAAADIAAALLVIARALEADPARTGTYHFAGRPETGWDGFAREIFDQAGLEVTVTPISSAEYPTPARRPLNSRLDCSATEEMFGIARPDWRESLGRVLQELSEAET